MAHSTSLIDLPPQAFEILGEQLSLPDIRNLRLTSRDLSIKQKSTFQSYLRSKTVSLSDQQSLQSFVTCTRPDQIGLSLEDLTIVGDVVTQQSDESISLLTEALSNLSSHSRHKGLHSLTFSLKHKARPAAFMVIDNRKQLWRAAWDCAVHTFRSTAEAVAQSSISIQRLDVFGLTQLCALPIDLLGLMAACFHLESLESLSLTLSPRLDQDANPEDDSAAQQITKLTSSLRRLTHLEVRWFSFNDWRASVTELRDRDFFATLAHTALPPLLTSVSIKGVYTSSDCLISFLVNHPGITRLSLEWLQLTQGDFEPLFAHFDENAELELYLNDLWYFRPTEKRLIQFPSTSGKRHFYHDGGPTWLRRTSSQRLRRRPIRYQQLKGVILASAAEVNWRGHRALLYGPIR